MVGSVLAILALTGCLSLCLLKIRRQRSQLLGLRAQIERFLSGEVAMPSFSVREGDFAALENDVAELETRLIQCEEGKRAERDRTAELLVDISHQLKTPLASLRLYCEIDQARHRAQNLRLIEHMEAMIASLLRLEKLRAGGYAFDFQQLSLSELAEEAARALRPLFPGCALRVEGEAEARCDACWMAEALSNLIKNACEHAGEGGHVHVRLAQSEHLVTLVVSDDGGGVPADELPNLFRRFFRSSNSKSRDGVGVGLAIVREVALRHHGTLSAENAGGGLKVTLALPALQSRLQVRLDAS